MSATKRTPPPERPAAPAIVSLVSPANLPTFALAWAKSLVWARQTAARGVALVELHLPGSEPKILNNLGIFTEAVREAEEWHATLQPILVAVLGPIFAAHREAMDMATSLIESSNETIDNTLPALQRRLVAYRHIAEAAQAHLATIDASTSPTAKRLQLAIDENLKIERETSK
jgi:hypothetical protein